MPNEFKVKNGLIVDQGGAFITGSSTISGSVSIKASGSSVFTVDGTSGRLFSIDDSLSGSLFSVNTISGLPVIEAFSDNTIRIGQYGQRALFVSQSKVGIGKEIGLNGVLDVSGSVTITGSFTASLQSGFAWVGDGNGMSRAVATSSFAGTAAAGTVSGSSQIDITQTTGYTAFSQSVAGTDASQSLQINSINSKTGSYATTGSNVFIGNQTVTGSLQTSGSNTLIGNTILSGSVSISGSTTQRGNNTLLGNTTLSGSLTISGSAPGSATNINIFGDVSLNGAIKFLPIVEDIDTSVSASYIYVSGSTQDLYFSQNGSGYNNVTRLRWLESTLGTGVLNGGNMTSTPGSTTFTVASGSGIIVSLNASLTSDPYPTIKYVVWPTQTLPITYSGSAKITYVGINNSGSVVQQTAAWGSNDINQWDNEISLGVVLHLSGSVSTGVFNSPQVSYGHSQQADDFFRAFGPLKISGHTLKASGSTMSIIKDGGSAYREGANYINNPSHPSTVVENSITVSKIYRYYLSGSTPVIDTGVGNAGYTTIDPTKYVNTTTGLLDTVNNGQYSLQRVFWVPNSPTNAFIVYYGNAKYNSLVDAINAKDTEPFTEAANTAINSIFLGYIAVAGGATSLTTAADATILQGGIFRNVGGVGSSGTNFVSTTLAGLSDVAITTPTNGQILQYNSSIAEWVNSSILNSYATTGSNQFVGNEIITGSLIMSGSSPITASIIGNPFGDLVLEAKSASLNTGSVEIHGGLKWRRTAASNPTEIGDLITFGGTMGLIEGGNLTTSSVGGLVVQVSPIVGYTMNVFAYGSHDIQKFDTLNTTDASRQLTLPQTSSVYVYYNSSATLTYNTTAPSTRNNIILGKVTTNASSIIYIDASQINAHHYGNYIDRLFREGLGPIFSTGGITTQGTISGSLNVSAATYFFSQNRITTNAGTNISMDTFYRSSTAGQYVRTTGVTTVNSASYDSGSGTLTNIPTGKYAKHSLYLLGDNSLQSTATEAYMMVYGQSIYDTLGDAQAGSLPTPPSFMTDSIAIIASIVVTPDSSSIQSIIDERPRLGFVSPSKTGVLTAHGDLTGLTNDDHAQYLLTDGTRTLTGNMNLGGNSISNILSVSATSITGSIRSTNGVVSGSSQIDLTQTTNYTSFSQSLSGTDTSQSVSILIASQSAVGAFQSASSYSSSAATVDLGQTLRLNTIESFTASIAATNTFTASVAGTNTFTASIAGTNLFTQSANLRLNALETSSASVISRVGSIESFTSSFSASNFQTDVTQSARLNALETFTASVAATNTFTASIAGTNVFTASIAGTNTFTQSANLRLNALETSSASVISSLTSINSKTGSYATTGSNNFQGNQTINGTLNVTNIIVTTITASTEYASGSTIFGSSNANTHEFTGSVKITGSLDVRGNTYLDGGFNRTGAQGAYSIAIGSGQSIGLASATGDNSVSIGGGASTTGIDAIAIGNGATGGNFSVAIGRSVTAATSEFVVGQGQGPITTMIVGSSRLGISNTVGNNLSITTSPGNGTDFAGGSITIAGGRGTGTGSSGDVIFATATPLTTGTTLQTSVQRWWIKGGNGTLTNKGTSSLAILDVSGSSIFTGSLNITGAVTATSFAGQINANNGVVSGSSQITLTSTTGYTEFSQSLSGTDASQSISILIASQSAVGAFQSASAYSSSAATVDLGQTLRLNSLESFTSSIGNVNSFTQSISLRLNALETSSASVVGRVGSIESFTSSVAATNTFTASVAGTNAFTASVNSSLTSLNSKTGSYATTGSNQFVGNQIITGSLVVSGSNGTTLLSSNVDTLLLTGSAIITGSLIVTGSINVSGSITGSLLSTNGVVSGSSQITLTSVTGYTAFSQSFAGTDQSASVNILIASQSAVGAFQSASAYSSSAATIDNGQTLRLNSLESFTSSIISTNTFTASVAGTNIFTASLVGTNTFTASIAGTNAFTQSVNSSLTSLNLRTGSYATTGSNTFTGSQTISGSATIINALAIGTSSLGGNENTLVIGLPPAGGVGEGGQLLLQAPNSGGYTSASMLDNWQNYTRLLRGTNTGSDAVITQWNMHSKQIAFPAYNSVSAFAGTAVANLAVDNSGNILTVSTSGGTVFPFTGIAQINGGLIVTGSITASTAIVAQANGAMYFRGGDDAEFWDINTVNTVGIYGQQDQTIASIKLGSGGGTISGRSGNIGINTTTPNSASLHVSGSIFATSITGSIVATNGVVSGSSQIDITTTTGYTTFSQSLAATDTSQSTQINTLNTFTASIAGTNTFTASVAGTNVFTASIAGTNTFTASIAGTNVFTQSAGLRLNALETSSASVVARIGSIESFTSSFSSSNFQTDATQSARLNSLETFTSSIVSTNTFTASIAATNVFTSSLVGTNTFTASIVGTNTFTASIAGTNTFTQSANLRLNALETSSASVVSRVGSLESFTSSFSASNFQTDVTQSLRLNAVETFTSSVAATNTFTASIAGTNTFTASILGTNTFTASVAGTNTFTQSANLRLNALETSSASVISRVGVIESFTSSIAGTNLFTASVSNSLTSINSKTGSYATTGSNTFQGNQTINGTLNVTNIVVTTVTASTQYTSGSTRFGSSSANTHEFTGSVNITGSTTITGGNFTLDGTSLLNWTGNDGLYVDRTQIYRNYFGNVFGRIQFNQGIAAYGSTMVGLVLSGFNNNTNALHIIRNQISTATNYYIGSNTTTNANLSASFHIDTPGQGVLLPRMSSAQRTGSILVPPQGLIVYDTGSMAEGFYYYSSGSIKSWTRLLNDTGSQVISGSLSVSGSLQVSLQSGYVLVGGPDNNSIAVTTSSFAGTAAAGTVSGSSQITLTSTTGYTEFSQSLAGTDTSQSLKINSLETFTSSVAATNTFTASIAATNVFTASLLGTNTFTASIAGTNTFTQSAGLRLNALETSSASVVARVGSIESFTSSFSASNFQTDVTQSLRLNSLETFTSSIASTNVFTASIAATNIFTASIAGTNTFTASIAGTNTFTASIAGTNTFTQSANLRLNALETSSASVVARIGSIESFTSSFSASNFQTDVTQSVRLNAIETFTASIASTNTFTASVAATNVFTASIAGTNTFTASIAGTNVFTQSVGLRLNALETSSASVVARVGSIESFTASVAGTNIFTASIAGTNVFTASIAGTNTFTASVSNSLTSINSKTGSYAITGSNQFVGNQIITGSLILSSSAVIQLTITGSVGITGSITSSNDIKVSGHNLGRGAGFLVENTVLGFEALGRNTSGTRNTAIGWYAISSSTTNGSNTAVGAVTQRFNTGGTNNSSLGEASLFSLTVGSFNTAVGFSALGSLTNGTNNVGMGYYAGDTLGDGSTPNTTSDNSIYIGYLAFTSQSNSQNEIVIGANSVGNGSNTVTLGNTSITNTYLRGVVSASSYQGSGANLTGVVTQIIAGTNISISPTSGTGSVTINASGGSATAGGSNRSIQFNDSTALSGSSRFNFDKTTNSLSLTGSMVVSGSSGITMQLFGSGSTIFSISGSNSELFKIVDTPTSPTLAVISSGSLNVLTVTTSSVIITGSLLISASMTASLQSGFALVGGPNNTSRAVATSSFGGGLRTKAGSVANTSFSGNPKKVTVTFSTAFTDTNYAITVTGEDARSWTIETKLAGSFIINTNSNTGLSGTTYWIATAYGETT